MTKKYNLKKELKRRNIPIEDLRISESYLMASIFKEDWNMDEITDWMLDSNLSYYHLKDSKFLKAVMKIWKNSDDKEWYYTKYLDDLQEIVEECKDTITIDCFKLKFWKEKRKRD